MQILPRLSRQSARGIVRWAKKQTDTGLLVRAQIVALLGVLTPGKNAKAYVAGALDARSRNIVWVGGSEKTSALFVALLDKLHDVYSDAKLVHIVLDNYGIHYSHETRRALRRLGRIRLHFLPPYSPKHNAIERFWQDLHANVTRNHKHADLPSLCGAVAEYLDAASPWLPKGS